GTLELAPKTLKLFGNAKFVWLRMLKHSARNWTLSRSLICVAFDKDISRFTVLGPIKLLRPKSPRVPAAGTAKAQGLNQLLALCTELTTALPPAWQAELGFAATGPGALGSPTTLGRSPRVGLPRFERS